MRTTPASGRTDGAQCTANFLFTDGSATYLGQAAHCSGTGGSTEVDGCTSGSLPLGTEVEIGGATRPGTLVYNSWLAMQEAGETDPDKARALLKYELAAPKGGEAPVPLLVDGDLVVWDTLAIGEYLHEIRPKAALLNELSTFIEA